MPRGRPRKSANDVLMQSAELIGWALGGLEREIVETKKRLALLTAQAVQLRNRVGKVHPAGSVAAPNAAAEGGKRRRRRMSLEARKRISEMMKKRWAERKKKG